VAIETRPPGRQTRASSAAACFWFAANMTPKVEMMPSKRRSGNGRRSASACWNAMAGRTWLDSSAAAASSSGEMSTAVTRAPLRATLRADQPVPVATSKISSPGPAWSRWAAWASASEIAKLTSSYARPPRPHMRAAPS
jgi:hypothetical protein